MPTEDDASAARKPPVTCIHCGYSLGRVAEGKCSECGNPVSDSLEGTLFYRLPPSRLTTISIGALAYALAAAFSALSVALAAVVALAAAPMWTSNWAIIPWQVLQIAHSLYAPLLALLMLGAPLDRRGEWLTWTRFTAIVLTLLSGVILAFYQSLDRSTLSVVNQTNSLIGWAARFTPVLDSGLGIVAAVQLVRIARRLPGSPLGRLTACALLAQMLVTLARTSISLGWPQRGDTAWNVLEVVIAGLLSVLPVAAFLAWRHLRAVALEVDADHPYARV